MRRIRVASFLADVTQQIHSFRASGVMAAQRLFAAASDSMARRKSDGSLWIMTPNGGAQPRRRRLERRVRPRLRMHVHPASGAQDCAIERK